MSKSKPPKKIHQNKLTRLYCLKEQDQFAYFALFGKHVRESEATFVRKKYVVLIPKKDPIKALRH